MKENRNYWLMRGQSGPEKDGFVCVGVGEEDGESLSQRLGVEWGELYAANYDEAEISPKWSGVDSERFYYLTEQKFNRLFPEEKENKEESKEEKILTLLAEVEKLKQEIEEEKMFKVGDLIFAFPCGKDFSFLLRVREVGKHEYLGEYLYVKGDIFPCPNGRFPFSDYSFAKVDL